MVKQFLHLTHQLFAQKQFLEIKKAKKFQDTQVKMEQLLRKIFQDIDLQKLLQIMMVIQNTSTKKLRLHSRIKKEMRFQEIQVKMANNLRKIFQATASQRLRNFQMAMQNTFMRKFQHHLFLKQSQASKTQLLGLMRMEIH